MSEKSVCFCKSLYYLYPSVDGGLLIEKEFISMQTFELYIYIYT